jgi:hypothetical protein
MSGIGCGTVIVNGLGDDSTPTFAFQEIKDINEMHHVGLAVPVLPMTILSWPMKPLVIVSGISLP